MTLDPVFSSILVAYDGSEPSKHALHIAARMVKMFRGELIIITVVPTVNIPLFSEYGYMTSTATASQLDYLDRIKESYQQSLGEAEKSIENIYPGIKVEAVLKEGRPSTLIVEEADNRNVALIVMGSRGLGGISGLVLGSTSQKVADRCTKPILIVK